MKKVEINNRMVSTNYGQDYAILSGDGPSTMHCEHMQWVLEDGAKYQTKEGERKMFERLVAQGYSKITFYRTTTTIRGYYEIIAYCK